MWSKIPWTVVAIFSALLACGTAVLLAKITSSEYQILLVIFIVVLFFVLMMNPKHRYFRVAMMAFGTVMASLGLPFFEFKISPESILFKVTNESEIPSTANYYLIFLVIVALILDFIERRQNKTNDKEKVDSEDTNVIPALITIPVVLDEEIISQQFVGRRIQIRNVLFSVQSILKKSKTSRTAQQSQTQLFWFHGFGGMGKTWFLRNIYITVTKKYKKLKIAMIDWDSNDWRAPLNTAPSLPEQIYLVVAHRLSQLYGTETFSEYWQMRERVNKSRQDHNKLMAEYRAAMTSIIKEATATSGDLHQLPITDSSSRVQVAVLNEVINEISVSIEKLIKISRGELDDRALFDAWTTRYGQQHDDAILHPERALLEALLIGFNRAIEIQPLLLIIDTCELLSPRLDNSLRALLAPIIAQNSAFIVLIGSRLRPDISKGIDWKEGWNDQISRDRFETIAFDEGLHFTLEEIALAIKGINYPDDKIDLLVKRLYMITHGVPFALRVLLDLHDCGDNVLFELAEDEFDLPAWINETNAGNVVLDRVTQRFFLHIQKNSEDFHSFLTIALQRRADINILKKVWDTENPYQRLRLLAQKYSVFITGDVHDTVRSYARKQWLISPPPKFNEVLNELEAATQVICPESNFVNQNEFENLVSNLYLKSWRNEKTSIKHLIQFIPSAVLLEIDVSGLTEIIEDLQFKNKEDQGLKELIIEWSKLPNWRQEDPYFYAKIYKIASSSWSEYNKRCCLLLQAFYHFVETDDDIKEPRAFDNAKLFDQNISVLNTARLHDIGRAYLDNIFRVSMDLENQEILERAVTWAKKNALIGEGFWKENANLLHNLGRYTEAVDSYQKAIESDPEDFILRILYFHTLHAHLEQYDETVKVGLEIIKEKPEHAYVRENLIWVLTYELHEYTLAKKLYDEGYIYLNECSRASCLLALTNSNNNGNQEYIEEFNTVLNSCLNSTDIDASDYNSLTWKLYLKKFNLDLTLKLANKAYQVNKVEEPDEDHGLVHTLLSILIALGDWDEAEDIFRNWASNIELSQLERKWHEYKLTFDDVIEMDLVDQVVTVLKSLENSHVWTTIIYTLENRLALPTELNTKLTT